MHHGDEEHSDQQRRLSVAEISAVGTRARLGAGQGDELVGVRVPRELTSDEVMDLLVDVERLAVGLARVLREERLRARAAARAR
jgi:hypothetical protein